MELSLIQMAIHWFMELTVADEMGLDMDQMADLLEELDPEETALVVVRKTAEKLHKTVTHPVQDWTGILMGGKALAMELGQMGNRSLDQGTVMEEMVLKMDPSLKMELGAMEGKAPRRDQRTALGQMESHLVETDQRIAEWVRKEMMTVMIQVTLQINMDPILSLGLVLMEDPCRGQDPEDSWVTN